MAAASPSQVSCSLYCSLVMSAPLSLCLLPIVKSWCQTATGIVWHAGLRCTRDVGSERWWLIGGA